MLAAGFLTGLIPGVGDRCCNWFCGSRSGSIYLEGNRNYGGAACPCSVMVAAECVCARGGGKVALRRAEARSWVCRYVGLGCLGRWEKGLWPWLSLSIRAASQPHREGAGNGRCRRRDVAGVRDQGPHPHPASKALSPLPSRHLLKCESHLELGSKPFLNSHCPQHKAVLSLTFKVPP